MRRPATLPVSMLLAGGVALASAPLLPAATRVADFESDDEVAAWALTSGDGFRVERSGRFATAGRSSLAFLGPAWRRGRPEWPAFQGRPSVADWSGYDRLVIDVTNPTAERPLFSMFVSDAKVPFRKGLAFRLELPALGFRRFVVPLSGFPAAVDRSDIAVVHLFTERPGADLALFIDNLVLLRPGESPPEPGREFVRQLVPLAGEATEGAGEALERCRAQAAAVADTPPLRASAERQLAECGALLEELRARLDAPDLTVAGLNEVNDRLERLPGRTERALSVIRLQRACAAAGQPDVGRMVVGLADSMVKVLPRDVPFDVAPAAEVELSLARNEKESFQLLVLPVGGGLRGVSVRAGDLSGPGGAVLGSGHVHCEVTGYVHTTRRPPYEASHVGWWPDPILDFLGPVDIEAGDLQSFWIRVETPPDQPPGDYRGRLAVSADGVASVDLELRVRVRSFALPGHSPLPLAITFSPHDSPTDATGAAQAEWRRSDDYPVNAWRKRRLQWADFLADYLIGYDSLYRHGPPDFEVIRRLHDRGRLVAFNLGIFDRVSRKGDAAEALDGLRGAYRRAAELGVLDHAYIYGFDECKPDQFPLLERTARTLRDEFPEALLMTTSYDDSYGLDSGVRTIDAWCPLTPRFDPERAVAARAAGRHVWWYICCGPHHPHANMFIEYPAIESRLLMGAMTARQRPDGFLYYQVSIWNSRRPIEDGPFTDWDPRSWTNYHGDGSWTCVGPGGRPLPTVRLENFRDGLEDYAYVVILGELARRIEAGRGGRTDGVTRWLAEAKAALAVPPELVRSMSDYSRDPAVLRAWRERLGDLIDDAGIPDVDPWGDDFGVRGFRPRG